MKDLHLSGEPSAQSVVDERWMRLAIQEAEAAGLAGEVPVGAVVVRQGQMIATGRNSPIASKDPTAHAEVNALRAAAAALGNYRLEGCELYVTLEPCPMCAGAILHSRLSRVVYGAADSRTGVAGSVLNLFEQPALNSHTQVQGQVLAADCAQPLQSFFQQRRAQARAVAEPLRDDALRTPDRCFSAYPPSAALQSTRSLPALNGLRLVWQVREAVEDGRDTPKPSAPPLVCLHGPGQWGWLFEPMWTLCTDRRVWVPDLPGHGRSDKPKKGQSLSVAWYAQVLAQWLKACELERVTLLFHPEMAEVLAHLQSQTTRIAHTVPLPAEVLQSLRPTSAGGQAARSKGSQHRASKAMPLPDWVQAPFPDKGHAAALKTWALSAPNADIVRPSGWPVVAELLRAQESR